MPSTSPGSSPGRLTRARLALRRVTLVQWVLVTMLGVGGLAFLRAFAGGEGVAVQRLAWGALAWTFPLLWDITAVIGSTLWIAAPRRTAAFRWGVFLNLTATAVSGLATGSQAFTLARDTLPDGWPWPAFASGAAVPLLYSILTWAAASARIALAPKETPWTEPEADPTTPTPPPTTYAEPAPLPPSSPPTSPEPATAPLELPTSAPSTPTPSPASPSASSTPAEAAPSPAGTPSSGTTASLPTPTTPSPDSSSGRGAGPTPEPSTPSEGTSDGPPSSTPDDRRAWAVAELLRRAEAPNAPELRPRDIDREFGMKDGWRVLAAAQRQVAEQVTVGATAGAEQ